jgi:hypothetical protein
MKYQVTFDKLIVGRSTKTVLITINFNTLEEAEAWVIAATNPTWTNFQITEESYLPVKDKK